MVEPSPSSPPVGLVVPAAADALAAAGGGPLAVLGADGSTGAFVGHDGTPTGAAAPG
jgi:hypothetical protein